MRPTDALPHPGDWFVKTLGKAVEIRRGLSWSKEQERDQPREDTVRVLRITNIQERLDLADILHLSGVPAKARELKKASRDWSIIVGSNGNRNRIGNAVLQTEDTDFLFASFLIAAKPYTESGVLPEFFFRWLSAYEVQVRISASSEGTTGLSNLSHDFFRKMEIAFPEAVEQRTIVCALTTADTAIDRTREAIAKARRLKRGLIQSFLHKMDAESGRLGQHITDIRYGTSQASNDKRWGFPTLRIPNIIGGSVNVDDLSFVDARAGDAERLALQGGDLLLVRTNGNPSYVGRSAVFSPLDDQRWLYASYLIRVRFNGEILPRFADEYLKSERGRRNLLRRVTTSAGNHNINTKSVLSLPIPIPKDKDQQSRFVALADSANVQIESLERCLLLAEKLKRGLMQDLLTGRVRVNGQTPTNVPRKEKPTPSSKKGP